VPESPSSWWLGHDDADATYPPATSFLRRPLSSDNLSKAGLQDLCNGFRLGKTGNKATLRDRLKKFSVDRREWDG